jgi:hypothetical protein
LDLKKDPTICYLQEMCITGKSKLRLKVKGWKKIFLSNRAPNQARIAILISNKANFR